MVHVQSISLTQFRNYDFVRFAFTERVVAIAGKNGLGKTNLLDALYYCCFTKSYFSSSDQQVSQFGKEGFRIEAQINEAPLTLVFRGTGKKELAVGGIPCAKMSQHIGRFPAVMIAPDDVELINGSSEIRRRFLDTTLSQLSAEYLQALIRHNKVLQQRNSFLKRCAETGYRDEALLDILDSQLAESGTVVFEERKRYCAAFIPIVQRFYLEIARNDELVSLLYDSPLETQSFPELLAANRSRDLLLQRTSSGPHRDELELQLNGQPFRQIASQGQRKSMLFSLKLAEYELLKSGMNKAPLLLLDDIFEKLDSDRMQHLLNWICLQDTAQVFITDTHPERVKEALDATRQAYQLITL